MWLLIVSAMQAVLQVMTIVLFGFAYSKMGVFTQKNQKWLSHLNMIFFTPCLLFSNIASTISLQKLLAFWPIPVFYAVFAFLCFVMSHWASRMMGLDQAYRRFVLACTIFGNTNSLPIAIISSLAVSEAGKILFWGPDDTQEAVAARGIAYTLFFAIFGNVMRWSYGYNLLKNHDGDNSHDKTAPLVSPNYGSTLPVTTPTPIRVAMPTRQMSTATLIVPVEHVKTASETMGQLIDTGLPSTRYGYWWMRMVKRIHAVMSPPLYAACLALFVGLTPCKRILYDKQSFLYPCLTKAIETCGRAAMPLILSCLGAQLAYITDCQSSASPKTRQPVATVLLVRFLLLPFIVIPMLVAFVTYGARWSLLATDPVFITMMIVLGCSPTAINLVQMTQVNGVFEEEMLQMLFWSYGVVCVPFCTLLVFVALAIVTKCM